MVSRVEQTRLIGNLECHLSLCEPSVAFLFLFWKFNFQQKSPCPVHKGADTKWFAEDKNRSCLKRNKCEITNTFGLANVKVKLWNRLSLSWMSQRFPEPCLPEFSQIGMQMSSAHQKIILHKKFKRDSKNSAEDILWADVTSTYMFLSLKVKDSTRCSISASWAEN